MEAFLLGTMPAAERTRFEQEMAQDADLRSEVELQRENMLAVELGGMQSSLCGIMDEEQRQVPQLWRILKYAAAAALLIAGAAWWFSRPPLNERLYAEYHVADPGLPVPMSATRDPDFQDAMVAYKLGDLEEARAKWSRLLSADPANDTLNYYIASADLSNGDVAASIPYFKAVATDSSSAFHAKARWYLFLAYLHEGRWQDMQALGLEHDPVYGERVRHIEDLIRE